MRVKTISVRSGATQNNPYKSYSNLQSSVQLDCELDPGEDFEATVKELQLMADVLVRQDIERRLTTLEVTSRAQGDPMRTYDVGIDPQEPPF